MIKILALARKETFQPCGSRKGVGRRIFTNMQLAARRAKNNQFHMDRGKSATFGQEL